MAARGKPAAERATKLAASALGEAPSEHIYIASEDLSADPAHGARTVRETIEVRNPLRHESTDLVLYEEGVLKVTERRKHKGAESFFLDLRFLDPIPSIERVVAKNWLLGAVGCATAAALAAFLLRFDAVYVVAISALAVCAVTGAGALYGSLYRSYERAEFRTLHGRTTVLSLTANVGARKALRAALPVLSSAIEEAAERITADTAAYLRAEMREHYRLRGDGVLDSTACASGTGRILAQFDVQL